MEIRFVILKILDGNFQDGFSTRLDVEDFKNNQPYPRIRDYPGQLRVVNNYDPLTIYRGWSEFFNSDNLTSKIRADKKKPKSKGSQAGIRTTQLIDSRKKNHEKLTKSIEEENFLYLNFDKNELKEQIDTLENPPREVHLIIQISKQESLEVAEVLQKLPWHKWSLLNGIIKHSETHISVNTRQYNYYSKKGHQQYYQTLQEKIIRSFVPKVRVLHIIGQTTKPNINIKPDKKVLKGLHQTEIVTLKEPSCQKLIATLKDKRGFDIIVYSGHSKSNESGDSAKIFLGEETTTIQALESSFRCAIENGLKLVVFNSCSSSQLAEMLLSYGMSTVISMKESIPDQVAHTFIESLFQEYSSKKRIGNKSLFQAVYKTVEKIEEEHNSKIPGASWLPIMHQNPAIPPLLWREIRQVPRLLRRILAVSSGIILFAIFIRLISLSDYSELKAYDLLLRWQPVAAELDKSIVAVTINKEDLDRLQSDLSHPEKNRISDYSLTQIIQEIQKGNPDVIGIDIWRDIAVPKNRISAHEELVKTINQSDNIYIVCEVATDQETTVAPPQNIKHEKLVYSDMLFDKPDNVIRTQLLKSTIPDYSKCPASNSLPFKLAEEYTSGNEKSDEKLSFLDELRIIFFRPQRRKISIKEVTISSFFDTPNPSFDIKRFENKIVLIGYDLYCDDKAIGLNDETCDRHSTSLENDLPGVIIHAQMTSQLLSIIQEDQDLIKAPPFLMDWFWIMFWGFVSGGTILILRLSNKKHGITYGIAIIGESGALILTNSLFFYQWGIWLPLVAPLFTIISIPITLIIYEAIIKD